MPTARERGKSSPGSTFSRRRRTLADADVDTLRAKFVCTACENDREPCEVCMFGYEWTDEGQTNAIATLLSALSAARARADQAERALQEIATGRTSEDDVAGPAQSGWMTAARLCEVARRALAAGENP
jgi:hypothetical protein